MRSSSRFPAHNGSVTTPDTSALTSPATGVNGWAGTSYGLLTVHRFPVGDTLLEFPRGGAGAGEDAAAAAVREMVEEMGPAWAGATLKRLGTIHPDSGLLTTEVTVYAAHLDYAPDTGHVEGITGAAQVWVSASGMPQLIGSGAITDAMTLAALALAVCAR